MRASKCAAVLLLVCLAGASASGVDGIKKKVNETVAPIVAGAQGAADSVKSTVTGKINSTAKLVPSGGPDAWKSAILLSWLKESGVYDIFNTSKIALPDVPAELQQKQVQALALLAQFNQTLASAQQLKNALVVAWLNETGALDVLTKLQNKTGVPFLSLVPSADSSAKPELHHFKLPSLPKIPSLPKHDLPDIEIPKIPKIEKAAPQIPHIDLPKLPTFNKSAPQIPDLPLPSLPKIPALTKPDLPKPFNLTLDDLLKALPFDTKKPNFTVPTLPSAESLLGAADSAKAALTKNATAAVDAWKSALLLSWLKESGVYDKAAKLSKAIADLHAHVEAAANNVTDAVHDKIAQGLSAVQSHVNDGLAIVAPVHDAINGLAKNVTDEVNEKIAQVHGAVQGAVANATGQINSKIAAVHGAAQAAANAVTGHINEKLGPLHDALNTALHNVTDRINGKIAAVSDGVHGAINNATGAVNEGVAVAHDAIKAAEKSVQQSVDSSIAAANAALEALSADPKAFVHNKINETLSTGVQALEEIAGTAEQLQAVALKAVQAQLANYTHEAEALLDAKIKAASEALDAAAVAAAKLHDAKQQAVGQAAGAAKAAIDALNKQVEAKLAQVNSTLAAAAAQVDAFEAAIPSLPATAATGGAESAALPTIPSIPKAALNLTDLPCSAVPAGKARQACYNSFVFKTQATSKAAGAVGCASLSSPSDVQACVNKWVVEQQKKKGDLKSCASVAPGEFQGCVNKWLQAQLAKLPLPHNATLSA